MPFMTIWRHRSRWKKTCWARRISAARAWGAGASNENPVARSRFQPSYGDDRVREAARPAHDRRCAVGERIHLAEAARLESRRHDERVRPGLDPMCDRLVVADERPEAAGSVRLEEAHRALERRLAGTQHHDADSAPDELGRGLEQEVEALLVRETSDRAEDHRGVARLEARDPAQLRAALGLPAQVLAPVMGGKVRVVRRAPDGRVDAVQDPDDAVPACVEDGVETDASLFRADLVRVRGGDGGDHVGGHDGALEEVHVAVKCNGAARPRGVGQAEDWEFLTAVDALIVEVVDRENGRDVVEPAVAPVAPRAEHRGERGMPVVRVEDSRPPVEPFQRLDRGPDEEREAPEPVVEPLVVRRVDLAAVEERIVRDEVDRHDAAGQEVPEEAHRVRAPEDRDLEWRERGLGPGIAAAVPARRLEVKRHEHVDVVPARRERLRKGAHDVSEASRLRERDALRCKVRDAQGGLSSRGRPP